MAVIKIAEFQGELPSYNADLLSPKHATKARNLLGEAGLIRPLKAPVNAWSFTQSDPATIFKYSDSVWFEWTTDVDVVRSVISNDTLERVYYSDGVYPKVTDNTLATSGSAPYPSSHYRLGVPAPTVAPSGVVGGTAGGSPQTRYYVYTYVDGYGAEGPPSPVSPEYIVEDGQYVDLTMTAPPGSPYNITKIRIYRTNTAGSAAVFQYVGEVTLPTTTFHDAVANADLGEALLSTSWDEPPNDVQGFTLLPGGIIAGFRANEVLFSEPGLPHAWPQPYRIATDYPIVGLAYAGTTLFVLTEGLPYAITGTHPQTMAATLLRTGYPCVSKRSISVIQGAVIYASNEGLVALSGGTAVLVSEPAFSREDWRALGPGTVETTPWGDLCLVTYTGVNGRAVLALNPASPDGGVVVYDEVPISTTYYDVPSSTLFVASDTGIAAWDAGASVRMTWRSKPFEISSPAPIAVAQVQAESYPVVLSLYADGKLQTRAAVGDNQPVRLGNATLAERYMLELDAIWPVKSVVVASSMSELKAV